MSGELGILNVGAGDTKLVFDKNNPQEMIRAARIVKDMLRRGYALLIEVDGGHQRVHDFREDTCEYIIADLDPVEAEKFYKEQEGAKSSEETASATETSSTTGRSSSKVRRGTRLKTIPATGARGVAVARTAGG